MVEDGPRSEAAEQDDTTMTVPFLMYFPCPPPRPVLLPEASPMPPRRMLAVGVG